MPTTYTITLKLSNSSNDLENGRVTASLPTYVEWLNIASPSSETISYDPVSRLVEWKLGDVDSNTGFGFDDRSVSFQVKLVPSISQVGTSPSILRNISFTGLDSFVERNIDTTSRDATTEIPAADSYSAGQVVK